VCAWRPVLIDDVLIQELPIWAVTTAGKPITSAATANTSWTRLIRCVPMGIPYVAIDDRPIRSSELCRMREQTVKQSTPSELSRGCGASGSQRFLLSDSPNGLRATRSHP